MHARGPSPAARFSRTAARATRITRNVMSEAGQGASAPPGTRSTRGRTAVCARPPAGARHTRTRLGLAATAVRFLHPPPSLSHSFLAVQIDASWLTRMPECPRSQTNQIRALRPLILVLLVLPVARSQVRLPLLLRFGLQGEQREMRESTDLTLPGACAQLRIKLLLR